MENDILIESWSHIGDVQEFVETNGKNTYFYLWFHPGKENSCIKSCWVCNNIKAPKSLDMDSLNEGVAPLMQEEFVAHDFNGIKLDDNKLDIIWLEEGNAAALFYDGDLIAYIPEWSGYNGFHGYSIYAKGTGSYAWELTQAKDNLMKRVEKAQKYLKQFDDDDYFGKVQDMHIEALSSFFGQYEEYYAIDGGEFPPKALVTGRKNGICYGITLGVSPFPMPLVESYYQKDAGKYRRIEIGIAIDEKLEFHMMKLLSTISGLSNLPWDENSFLGHGHTIPFDGIEGYVALWFLSSQVVKEYNRSWRKKQSD